jgi:hypothetical protein
VNRPKCQGITHKGTPCNTTTRPDSSWCVWHDPALEEERNTWRRKGGRGKSNVRRAAKRLPEDLHDVQLVLLRTLQGIEDGTLEPKRAQALAAVARAFCTVHEKGELERRLAEAPLNPYFVEKPPFTEADEEAAYRIFMELEEERAARNLNSQEERARFNEALLLVDEDGPE